MSYSIILKCKNKEAKEIPFSTNKTYKEYWFPLIDKLNLELLEYFQYGFEILDDDLSNLILEFEKISKIVKEQKNKNRIDFILNELNQIEQSECSSIYIG